MDVHIVVYLASGDARPPVGAIHCRKQALQCIANGQLVRSHSFVYAAVADLQAEDSRTSREASICDCRYMNGWDFSLLGTLACLELAFIGP